MSEFDLPCDLPHPEDDGAAAHLEGMRMPEMGLQATDGTVVVLSDLPGRFVIYVYPMTGRPGAALPDGWDGIPGARGCTPQSCSFRDHYRELQELNTEVAGLSAQASEYQREARDRLHLPFELWSDPSMRLGSLLRLPTFRAGELDLYKRTTLIVDHARIVRVFYPVFPPDRNAQAVLEWLRSTGSPQLPLKRSGSST